jgi:hypothetical protein
MLGDMRACDHPAELLLHPDLRLMRLAEKRKRRIVR